MADTWAVLRMPSEGLLAGDLAREHRGSRVIGVFAKSRATEGAVIMNNVIAVEGVPPQGIAEFLHRWKMHYGLAPSELGDGACLLPSRLDKVSARPIAVLLGSFVASGSVCNLVEGDHYEMWIPCKSPTHAAEEAGRMKAFMAKAGAPAQTRVASPDPHIEATWTRLRTLGIPGGWGHPL